MAIYHLAVKSVSRSTGRSAVAAIAYRAGVELVNERDGLVHDYTRRGGVEDAFIVVPEGAEWAHASGRERRWRRSGRRAKRTAASAPSRYSTRQKSRVTSTEKVQRPSRSPRATSSRTRSKNT